MECLSTLYQRQACSKCNPVFSMVLVPACNRLAGVFEMYLCCKCFSAPMLVQAGIRCCNKACRIWVTAHRHIQLRLCCMMLCHAAKITYLLPIVMEVIARMKSNPGLTSLFVHRASAWWVRMTCVCTWTSGTRSTGPHTRSWTSSRRSSTGQCSNQIASHT